MRLSQTNKTSGRLASSALSNLAQAGRSGCSSAEPYPPAWLNFSMPAAHAAGKPFNLFSQETTLLVK
jgi:hypothetical protein